MANRGEIAVRIVRAARELGIATVAVFSEADRGGLWARLADEAVEIGPAPSRESYLAPARILAAAKKTGADSIHPGYGFLSENAAFARAVQKAKLVWIGPPPDAMERMGSKVSARKEAQAARVPVAPGSGVLRDAKHAEAEAKRIGYPVLLKASNGGGGIGMRIVRSAKEIPPQLESARAQALAAFGSSDVFLERYLEKPRHIEIQILADNHGRVLHLGERECSIQRRHQKLVEEAPSPALSPKQRADIGAKAVALAERVGYQNAGTMEFLYEDGEFFFNEMNTRLQVEHPVTELVTGIDIVQAQLRIAGGEKLWFGQDDVELRGHAIELRINAEEPLRDFAPSPGTVRALHLPAGPGIRCDTALEPGWTVPPDYDSLVLKLIAWASDRKGACQRLERALSEVGIDGFATNLDFQRAVVENARFRKGQFTTRFLEEEDLVAGLQARRRRDVAAIVAAIARRPGGLAAAAAGTVALRPLQRVSGRRNWEAA